MLWLATKYPDVDIAAICDIDERMIGDALKIIKDGGKSEPHIYKNGDEDFLNMLNNEELDGVYIATSMEVAPSNVCCSHEIRKTCRYGSTGCFDGRRLLGSCGNIRKNRKIGA